ncbi:hypothetical protein AGRO_1175 [Agrobacterium sp. ATCC 31749]|nr:hypothetical protein AGRO_1175 [Agrobacterium sp. ATCC 31749]
MPDTPCCHARLNSAVASDCKRTPRFRNDFREISMTSPAVSPHPR